MTTIVVDREMGYIAADRKAVSNECEVAIECPKIRGIELSDGIHLMACSGMESSAQIFENWYRDGDWDELPETMESTEPEDDFTAVVLTPDYEIWLADKFMCPYQVFADVEVIRNRNRWYGVGTGAPFAWAVLWAGMGIDKAMEAAIAMDPGSGFGYDIEYLEDSSYG